MSEGNPRRNDKFIMVRLHRSVHAKLVAFRDSLATYAAENPKRVPPFLLEEGFGLGQAILELLRRADNHRARSRSQTQRGLRKSKN